MISVGGMIKNILKEYIKDKNKLNVCLNKILAILRNISWY